MLLSVLPISCIPWDIGLIYLEVAIAPASAMVGARLTTARIFIEKERICVIS
jgi:hypothetical protein